MANNTGNNNNDTSNRNSNTKPIKNQIRESLAQLYNIACMTAGKDRLFNNLKLKTMYYKKQKPNKTSLKRNTSYEGETIEKKINRIVNNKEPIKDGAPIIYTDRREGVKPEYDIRTDRFELAVEGTDYLNKTHLTKRQDRQQSKTDKEKADKEIQQKAIEGMKKENGEAEPIQATDN